MRAVALAIVLCAGPALAWDTWISTRHNWGSVYSSKFGGVGSYAAMYMDPKGNEHAEISDHTLFTISDQLGGLFGTHADPSCAMGCPQMPTIVDLNASFMRPELIGVDDLGNTQVPSTVLEERRFPRMAMWAGLPDWNYTVYDWINKSTRCPSLPQTADHYELCHVYRAWLGAGLNSTHMGQLNVKVYERIHATAMRQAQRAAQLKQLLRGRGRKGTLPAAGADWYADYVREAELMALIYEQVGQHFMHDRWSIGHMFSRWGPGSYEELNQATPGRVSLDKVSSYGTLTGIVHGSLAVFGKPDPLSAPLIDYAVVVGNDTAQVMSWRYSQKNALFSDPDTTRYFGLGDYLYKDIVDDFFDGSVLHPRFQSIDKTDKLFPVKAGQQKKSILTCGGDGLRTVIAAFDEQAGTFGEFKLALPMPNANQTLPGATPKGTNPATNLLCTDPWAANDSYYTSARTIAGSTWLLGDGIFNDIVVAIGTAIEGEDEIILPPSVREEHGIQAIPKYTPPIRRVVAPLGRVMWRAWVNKKHDETSAQGSLVRYGVDSAKVGMSFSDNGIPYRPNGQYAVPAFYEPEDLDTLPWFNETRMSGKLPSGGKDRAAIDGFFNKARTETWCGMLYGNEKNDKKVAVTLKMLREKGLEYEIDGKRSIPTGATNAKRARAMCSYLANRVYKQTDENYKGATATRVEIIGEHLPLDGGAKYGPSYEPICAYFDGTGTADAGIPIITADAKDDDKPYQIKPGYVSQVGGAGQWGYAPKTLENWCELLPVIEIGFIPNEPDAAGELLHDNGDRFLYLKGENLGIKSPNGKVGTVVAVDKDGLPHSLDIWDPYLKKDSGGWSSDNLNLRARIPGSGNGFDTNATASMTPDVIKTLAPKIYTFELTRPDDIQARPFYRANGAKTVGTYKFRLHTSWVEEPMFSATGGLKGKAVWVTHPEWSRPQTTVLKEKLYRVSGTSYTEVTDADLATAGVTVTKRVGEYAVVGANGTLTWMPDKDRTSYYFTHPTQLPQSIFASDTVFFFAFH